MSDYDSTHVQELPYTQVPNVVLDKLDEFETMAEMKIVLAVVRQTYGWHKQTDRLSLSQLEAKTGLSRRSVIDGTELALEHDWIKREPSGDSYDYWLSSSRLDQVLLAMLDRQLVQGMHYPDGSGSAGNALGGSAENALTKEIVLKQKDSIGANAPMPNQPGKQDIIPDGQKVHYRGITIVKSTVVDQPASRAGEPPRPALEQAPTMVFEVPQGGNKAKRAEFTARCTFSGCKPPITQHMDACPTCGVAVKWVDSKIADERYRQQANHDTDKLAKAKRARPPLSDFTGFVLEWARDKAAAPESVVFIKGEEQQLLAYEQQIGAEALMKEIARIMAKDNPPAGRGRILNLLRSVPFMAARPVEPEEPEMVSER
jgi:hypothetical protein